MVNGGVIVLNILYLVQYCWYCSFSFVKREGNSVIVKREGNLVNGGEIVLDILGHTRARRHGKTNKIRSDNMIKENSI